MTERAIITENIKTAGSGRRLALTTERQGRLVYAVSLGAPWRLAAAYGGISGSTLARYRRLGQAAAEKTEKELELTPEEDFFFELHCDLMLAEAQAVIGWLKHIDDAMAEKWQAAAWMLERRYPEHFGRRSANVDVHIFDVREWESSRSKRLEAVSALVAEAEKYADIFSVQAADIGEEALQSLPTDVVDGEYTEG